MCMYVCIYMLCPIQSVGCFHACVYVFPNMYTCIYVNYVTFKQCDACEISIFR